jgi:hypothetical protein
MLCLQAIRECAHDPGIWLRAISPGRGLQRGRCSTAQGDSIRISRKRCPNPGCKHRRVSLRMSRFSVAWAVGHGCACACVANVTKVEERMQEWFSQKSRNVCKSGFHVPLALSSCWRVWMRKLPGRNCWRFLKDLGPRRKSKRAHQHYTPSTYFPLISGSSFSF